MDYPVEYQVLNFALIPDTLLSADYNLFLSDLGSVQPAEILSDETGLLHVGEQVSYGGRTVEILGSGTAQPGVQILSLVVPTGSAVDVVYMRDIDTDELILAYPEGPPNLLSAIAVVLTIDEVGYDLTTSAPVCFCRGTRIATTRGMVPVERVRRGDHVLDWQGRVLEVLACVCTRYDTPPAEWLPVVFDPGALGEGLPRRRVKVSPQHRVCLPGSAPGRDPLLGPARAFSVLPHVRQKGRAAKVVYYHLVTERHALLDTEGLPTETLLLTSESLRHFHPDTLKALSDQLGVPAEQLANHPAAQPCGQVVTCQDAQKLLAAWAVQSRLSPENSPAPWPASRPIRLAA